MRVVCTTGACVLFLCVNIACERRVTMQVHNDDVMSFNWIHMKTEWCDDDVMTLQRIVKMMIKVQGLDTARSRSSASSRQLLHTYKLLFSILYLVHNTSIGSNRLYTFAMKIMLSVKPFQKQIEIFLILTSVNCIISDCFNQLNNIIGI